MKIWIVYEPDFWPRWTAKTDEIRTGHHLTRSMAIKSLKRKIERAKKYSSEELEV